MLSLPKIHVENCFIKFTDIHFFTFIFRIFKVLKNLIVILIFPSVISHTDIGQIAQIISCKNFVQDIMNCSGKGLILFFVLKKSVGRKLWHLRLFFERGLYCYAILNSVLILIYTVSQDLLLKSTDESERITF